MTVLPVYHLRSEEENDVPCSWNSVEVSWVDYTTVMTTDNVLTTRGHIRGGACASHHKYAAVRYLSQVSGT
jgi:hypothetical protein